MAPLVLLGGTSMFSRGPAPWHRFSVRVAAAFAAVTTLGIGLTGATIYSVETRTIEDSLGARLLHIARTGSLLVDSELHAEVEATLSRDSPAYRQLQATFAAIQDHNELGDPIYTLTGFDPAVRRAHFMVTSRGPADPGEDYFIVPELMEPLRRAFVDGIPTQTRVYLNQHGTWITAFAPLRDPAGEIYAVLDVDFRVDVYLAQRTRMRYLIAAASTLGGLVALAVGVFVTRRIAGPVTALAQGAARVASGNLSQPVPVVGQDEVGCLTQVFNRMMREVEIRTPVAPEDVSSQYRRSR